jgi:hypothetical protein
MQTHAETLLQGWRTSHHCYFAFMRGLYCPVPQRVGHARRDVTNIEACPAFDEKPTEVPTEMLRDSNDTERDEH